MAASSKTFKQKLKSGKGLKPVELTKEQALLFQRRIQNNIRKTRGFIYEMFCGGFRALGRKSFYEWIIHGFGKQAKSTIYREKDAAVIEEILGYEVGSIKNGSFFELLTHLNSEEDVVFVWEEGQKLAGGKLPSAEMIKEIIEDHGLIKKKIPSQSKPEAAIKNIIKNIALLATLEHCEIIHQALQKRVVSLKNPRLRFINIKTQ